MKKFFALFLFLFTSANAHASWVGRYFDNMGREIGEIWRKPDSFDIASPFVMWHNRLFWDEDEARRFNENPRGGGIGLTKDYDKREAGLVFMAFHDSFEKIQIIWGYTSLHKASIVGDLKVNYGHIFGIHQRYNYISYTPIPMPLPIAGLSYGPLSVDATYIPGWHNFGNVLFVWARLRIEL
ncbi:MAG: hypothetical protein FWD15_00620 [Alphaproteobacteria bacterium]|nr:hypothetical protein [Alphaproteobacteria bacterium]